MLERQEDFQRLTEVHRAELRLHCYRMLGSLHEAEDLVQDTYLRAWRGRAAFQGKASVRGWLYRIATNACLDVLARRATARRLLPEAAGLPAAGLPDEVPDNDVPWLEPFPDALLEGIADRAPGPDVRYETREAVQLAFVAAIQHLAHRPRAILLLRDVLGWSAAEAAELLDTSETSVNSALRRARSTLRRHLPDGAQAELRRADQAERELLDRYLRTWEAADVDAFVAVLREDALVSMPPWREWYAGRQAIRALLGWRWAPDRGWRNVLVPTAANGQPAFAQYRVDRDHPEGKPSSIHVLTIERGEIAAVTYFVDPRLVAAFGLPPSPCSTHLTEGRRPESD
jgi:RNA polymerase sigma-70 factor, ECF subfamily